MGLNRDLLAELELTTIPSLRPSPGPGLYVPAGERAEGVTRRGSSRRSFWCALKEQAVEVEFEAKRILGFPRLVGVKCCSAFDEPGKVACGRRCLDSKFRRQWPFALPTADRRRTLGG
jgi:hypothetical protein